MDNQAAMSSRTALDDLLYLVEGRHKKQIEKCLPLARKVFKALNIDTDGTPSQREALLQRVMSNVADHVRGQAHAIPKPVMEPANNSAFQAAAAAELLSFPGDDDVEFLRLRDDYCRYFGRSWDDLENNADNESAGRIRRLRAGIWIVKSGRTAYDQRGTLLKAFEDVMDAYLKKKEVQEELRAITVSDAEFSSLLEANASACAPLNTPAPESNFLAGEMYQPPHVTDPELRNTIKKLADIVRRQWQEERRHRKDSDPFLLPVRWRKAPRQYVDHWENIRRDRTQSEPLDLPDTLDSIADVFGSIPSGKLVILGEAGAGKTTVAIELLLSLLKPERRSPSEPVPIKFDLASWDPEQQSLRDWMAKFLIAEYRETSSHELVQGGHIIPILDGFDELAPGVRTAAIQALNSSLEYGEKVIVTSRPTEYYDAVDASDVISHAAVIILEDLTLDDLEQYLPLTARPLEDENENRSKWDRVLAYMRSAHSSESHKEILLTVLRIPLMVSLARAIYSDDNSADPTELLDPNRFPNTAALSDHLLTQFVHTRYEHGIQNGTAKPQKPYDVEDAQRWLGFLAVRMHALGTRNLSWWNMTITRSRSMLGRTTTLIVLVGISLIASTGLNHSVLAAIAGLACLAIGLRYFMYFIRGSFYLLEPQVLQAKHFVSMSTLAYSLILILMLVMLLVAKPGELTPDGQPIAWILFGSAIVSLLILCAGMVSVPNLTSAPSPGYLLRTDQTSALVSGILQGIAVSLLFIVPSLLAGSILWHFVPMILLSITVTVVGTFLTSPSGRWFICRLWPGATDRLPWSLMRFLQDAHRRGLLRQAGGTYQFRHAALHDLLAHQYLQNDGNSLPRRVALRSRQNLAVSWRESDRIDAAETELRSLLEERRQNLGPHHPETLISWYELVVTLQRNAQIDSALQEAQSLLEIYSQPVRVRSLHGLPRQWKMKFQLLILKRKRETREIEERFAEKLKRMIDQLERTKERAVLTE